MNNLLKLLIIVNLSWAVGFQSLLIPPNSEQLSTSSTGIAGSLDPFLNPAIDTSQSYLQYSINTWLGDQKGNQGLIKWGGKIPQQFSIQTWNAEKIELRGDYPSDSPLETFSTHFISTSYSISHDFNTHFRFGISIKANYSRILTESMKGLAIDLGTSIPISNNYKLGVVIRNLGEQTNQKIKSKFPIEYGFGSFAFIPKVKTSILSDIVYNEIGTEFRVAIKTNWKFINLNAGSTILGNRKAQAIGLVINYKKWRVNYSVFFHDECQICGIPKFIDIRRYL